MTILMSSDRYMFDVFKIGESYYMTVTTGGVAQYDITACLTEQDVIDFRQDENKAIAMSIDIVTRTTAYEKRIINPSIDPV